MIDRWILFYDGACPLCMKTKSKLPSLLGDGIRLTAVDINGSVAKTKGYPSDKVVLETPQGIYHGHKAWLKILTRTKYRWVTRIYLRPFFIIFYYIVSRNRKLIGKLL